MKNNQLVTIFLTSPPSPLHRRGALCATQMNRAMAPSPVERAGGEVKKTGITKFFHFGTIAICF